MAEVEIDGELTEREKLVAQSAADAILDRIMPLLHRLMASVLIALIIGIGGGALGWFLTADESNDRVHALAMESVARAKAIQASRYRSTRDNCEEMNARNRKALAKLGELNTILTGSQRQRQASIDAFREIIDAGVPYRSNCAAFARSRSQARIPSSS